jgi:formylglycine-generating enzyme required for sulfatase activity
MRKRGGSWDNEPATRIKIIRQQKQVEGFIENCQGMSLEMIKIPSGNFMRGSPETEAESIDREKPQRKVTIAQFFMGRYPVTQSQWRVVAMLKPVLRKLKLTPSRFQGDNRPVEQVSWYDAMEFCARLSRESQRNYRLPSEAEWEYACRAGTTTPFHFGETISTDLANYNGSDDKYGAYGRGIRGEYRRETTDVDYFSAANPFGLSEMHGNVWEWCLDPWHDNYQGAPEDGRVWDERNKNENHYQNILENLGDLLKDNRRRVLRGGSWDAGPGLCRSAYRSSNDPGYGFNRCGFRVVCVPPRTL